MQPKTLEPEWGHEWSEISIISSFPYSLIRLLTLWESFRFQTEMDKINS